MHMKKRIKVLFHVNRYNNRENFKCEKRYAASANKHLISLHSPYETIKLFPRRNVFLPAGATGFLLITLRFTLNFWVVFAYMTN